MYYSLEEGKKTFFLESNVDKSITHVNLEYKTYSEEDLYTIAAQKLSERYNKNISSNDFDLIFRGDLIKDIDTTSFSYDTKIFVTPRDDKENLFTTRPLEPRKEFVGSFVLDTNQIRLSIEGRRVTKQSIRKFLDDHEDIEVSLGDHNVILVKGDDYVNIIVDSNNMNLEFTLDPGEIEKQLRDLL